MRLRPADLSVRLFGADDDGGVYTFVCPQCANWVTRKASARIVSLLVSAGVRRDVVSAPAEIFEPHDGPPIDTDDLLDFHLLLQTDGWVQQLNEMVRGAGN